MQLLLGGFLAVRSPHLGQLQPQLGQPGGCLEQLLGLPVVVFLGMLEQTLA